MNEFKLKINCCGSKFAVFLGLLGFTMLFEATGSSVSCARNQFASSSNGEDICVDCFCNELNVRCRRSMYFSSLIQLKDDVTKIKVTDGNSLITNGLYFNSDHEVILGNVPQLESSSLYWLLPNKFLGNQILSYGGVLSYSIFYDVWSTTEPYLGNDIKIKGKNGVTLYYYSNMKIKPKVTQRVKIQIVEGKLTRENGSPADRNSIMKVLMNIQSISIRAAYSPDTKLTILSSVSMETAIAYFTRRGLAKLVEHCLCPAGYSGLSCETCQRGYTRSSVSDNKAKCVRCQCNRHTLECDPETGVCQNCKHNTFGDNCEKCMPGYYGNAQIGTTGDCQRCSCPLSIPSNQFSSTCHIAVGGVVKCDACQRGYKGDDCGECAAGYSGNPRIPGGKCALIAKITQRTPSVKITPERRVDPLGYRATFRCDVEGVTPYFVTWSRRDARPLPRGRHRVLTQKGTRVLIISSLTIDDEGDYICTARNMYGVASEKVWMNVYEHKVSPVEVNVSPKSLRIIEGSSALFLCSVRWNAVTHTRSWSREGYRLLPPTAKVHDGTLMFKDAKKSDSGVYTCTASNQVTVATATVVLSVGAITKAQISLWPIHQTVDAGDPATFHCSASGFPRPEIYWSHKNGKSIESRYSFNGQGIMKIRNVRIEDEGEYSCNARNIGGEVSRKAMLYVRAPGRSLSISVFPKVHKVKVGADIAFTCVASGRPLPSVSWTSLHGKMSKKVKVHNGVLTVTDVGFNESGIYLCTAKNPYGAASAKVKLKVYKRVNQLKVALQPRTLKLSEGESAGLFCNISGDVSVITWSKANGILSVNHAVHGKILNISKASVEDEGTYFCTASNNEGVAQGSAIVTVERKVPPQITVLPSSKTVTEVGSRVHFRCVVTEGEPITSLAWHSENGSIITNSSSKTNTSMGLLLEFRKVEKKHEGDYICAVRNNYGFMRAVAVLKVSGFPKIKLRPSGKYYAVTGDDIMLECESTGYPVPKVEWILPGAEGSLEASISSWPGYARIQMKASMGINGEFQCKASNDEGVSQDSVFVAVTNETTKPFVVVSPTVVLANVGNRVEIKCQPSGIPSPEFIWVKLRQNAKSQVVSSNAVLVFDDIQMTDDGSYSCRAWNRLGIAQAHAKVIVSVPPKVSVSPTSVVVLSERSFTLQCIAAGYPQPSINWRKSDGDMPTDCTVVNGTMHVTNVKLKDAGVYQCEASNRGGNVTKIANVTVLDPPKISGTSRVEHTAKIGQNVTFYCNVTGHPSPTITWYKDADLIGGSSNGLLTMANVTSSSHGQYKCRARNIAGFAEEVFSLAIEEVPTVSIMDKVGTSLKVVPIGQNITLTCIATGNPEPVIQWTKIGGKLPDDYIVQDGTLTIIRAKVSDAGTFRCSVFNSVGHVHAEVRIDVQGAPTVNVSPKSIKTQIGQEARLTCIVTGMPKPTVSWHKLGGSLPPNFIENGELILPKVRSGDKGDYICRAVNSEGSAEDHAKLRTTDFLPRFSEDGQSYIIFGKILGALYRTSIEISFRSENEDGLLLYNGRPNEDFISLGIIKGYVVFQYNLGSGPAFIRSSNKLSLFEWHTVHVSRDGLDGTLKVDAEPILYGKSKGKYTGLNLVGDLFVGGHANLDIIKRQTMHERGFTGCISQLVIGGQSFEIAEKSLMMVGITDCNICLTQPCRNDGLCLASATHLGFTCECQPGFTDHDCSDRIARCFPGACGEDGHCINTGNQNFKCKCPIGRYGSRCEIGQTITMPSFSNNSFMVYPGIKGAWEQLSIYIKFRPASYNGILLLNGGVDIGKKSQDFISIQIDSGYAQLQFDSGSGAALIQSSGKIELNSWNTIEVERFRKFGSITLNAGMAQKGVSHGSSIALNLGPELYIGGTDHKSIPSVAWHRLGGFHGCIHEVIINNKRIELVKDFTHYQGVTNCHSKASPCHSSPCQNNATCEVLSAVTYSCKCQPRYHGKHCETFTSRCGVVDDCLNGGVCVTNAHYELSCQCMLGFTGSACEQAIQIRNEALFKGDGYLQYPRNILRKVELSYIKFDMKSKANDGLIFWFGETEDKTKEESPDFLAIGLKNGFLEVSYELGSGLAVVITAKQINDGEWHTVIVSRAARNATLWIDGAKIGQTQSSGINTKLDIEASMYFGGARDVSLMTRQKYQHSYAGCLSNVYIEDQLLILQKMAEDGRSVHPCTEKSI